MIVQKQGKNIALLAILVFIAALTLRAPFLRYPPSIVFDEGLYADFATKFLHHEPYFDVHPPLAGMLFAAAAWPHVKPTRTLHDIGSSFETFPYVRTRALNVLFGALLAPIVFFISYLLFGARWWAALSGLLVAFDNALIVYSRAILPETPLLFFGFLGVLLFIASCKRRSWFLLVASAVLFGAAISIKWIGLGFPVPVLVYLFFKKRFFAIAAMSVTVLFVYIFVFHIFFMRVGSTPFSGKLVSEYRYSNGANIVETTRFLARHTVVMYRANFTIPAHLAASYPLLWPFGQKPVGFWAVGTDRIVLTPNLFGWWFVYLSVLVSALLYFLKKDFVHRRRVGYLLLAYSALYFPFFALWRPFFLYHYFSAVVFGYLMVPVAFSYILSIIAPRYSYQKAAAIAAALIIFSWALVSPLTYGF